MKIDSSKIAETLKKETGFAYWEKRNPQFKCPKHKTYKGLRKPRGCVFCLCVYRQKLLAECLATLGKYNATFDE